jgi:hypothetical protein
MALMKAAWWLLLLPIRLLFWVVGLTLWVLTLPLRFFFGALGLIGLGRIFRVAFLASAGYFVYRLVNRQPENWESTEFVASPPEPAMQGPAAP